MKCIQLAITDIQYVKCSHSYVRNTLQPRRQSMEQEYHYWHEIESTDQVWDFRDDVCRIESGNFMKCVQLASTDVQYVKCSHSYVWNTLQPHSQSMEHSSITIGMKLKVLIKCGTSCAEVRANNLLNVYSWPLQMYSKRNILTLVCTEHTSTTSPVDGTQRYHYWKSTDQVWDFRDVCKIESGKFMKCVQLAITYVQYVKCSHSYARNTLQPHRQSMEHRSVTIGVKLKVLIKYGTSEMMCAELRVENL